MAKLVVLSDGETYDIVDNVTIVEVDDDILYSGELNGKDLKEIVLNHEPREEIRLLGTLDEISIEKAINPPT